MNIKEFVKWANDERLANKGEWIQLSGVVDGNSVQDKAFNTWIQVWRVDSIQTGSPMEMKVGEFKEWLEKELTLANIFIDDNKTVGIL